MTFVIEPASLRVPSTLYTGIGWVLGDLELVRLVPGLREVLEQVEVQPEGGVSWGQECGEQTGRLH